MNVIVEQRPSEAVGFSRNQKIGQPRYERMTVFIVVEDISLFDAAHDNMLQDVRNVDAG